MAGIKPTDFPTIVPQPTTLIFTQDATSNGKYTLANISSKLELIAPNTYRMTNTDQTTTTFVIPTVNMPTFINNNDGTFTYDDKINPPVTIDFSKGSIVNNGNKTYTYTHFDGSTILLDLRMDILSNNLDGTYTYTPVIGSPYTIDARHSSMTEPTPGSYEYTDYNGNITTINTCRTSITETSPNVFEFDNCTLGTPVVLDTRHSNLEASPTNPQQYIYTRYDGNTTTINNAPFLVTETPTASVYNFGLGDKQVYRQVYVLDNTFFVSSNMGTFELFDNNVILRPSGYYDRILKIEGTFNGNIRGVQQIGSISALQLPATNYSLSGFQIVDDTINHVLQWEFRLDNSIPPTIDEVIIIIEYTKN